MVNDTIKGAIGTVGTLGLEATKHIDPNTINEGVGLIGQLLIIIVTLVGLFKKKKPKIEKESEYLKK